MSAAARTLEAVRAAGVIGVLRAPSPEAAVETAEALLDGGVGAIEVTYSTPDVPAVLRELRARRPGALLGAGTLLEPEQAAEAADAGASFLVSPGLDDELVAAMRATGALVMAGAITPTEVMRARRLGVDVVKLFPGSTGGPALLRALRAPFRDMTFLPTGGVSPDNVGDWLAAGAVAVAAGGELSPVGATPAQLRERAATFAGALAAARAKVGP